MSRWDGIAWTPSSSAPPRARPRTSPSRPGATACRTEARCLRPWRSPRLGWARWQSMRRRAMRLKRGSIESGVAHRRRFRLGRGMLTWRRGRGRRRGRGGSQSRRTALGRLGWWPAGMGLDRKARLLQGQSGEWRKRRGEECSSRGRGWLGEAGVSSKTLIQREKGDRDSGVKKKMQNKDSSWLCFCSLL